MADNEATSSRFPIKTFGTGVLAVLLIVFWSQNRDRVKITFLVFDANVRIWIALLVSGLAGVAIGMLVRGGLGKD